MKGRKEIVVAILVALGVLLTVGTYLKSAGTISCKADGVGWQGILHQGLVGRTHLRFIVHNQDRPLNSVWVEGIQGSNQGLVIPRFEHKSGHSNGCLQHIAPGLAKQHKRHPAQSRVMTKAAYE